MFPLSSQQQQSRQRNPFMRPLRALSIQYRNDRSKVFLWRTFIPTPWVGTGPLFGGDLFKTSLSVTSLRRCTWASPFRHKRYSIIRWVLSLISVRSTFRHKKRLQDIEIIRSVLLDVLGSSDRCKLPGINLLSHCVISRC